MLGYGDFKQVFLSLFQKICDRKRSNVKLFFIQDGKVSSWYNQMMVGVLKKSNSAFYFYSVSKMVTWTLCFWLQGASWSWRKFQIISWMGGMMPLKRVLKGCSWRVLCILVRKVNRDVYIQLAVLHFYGTFYSVFGKVSNFSSFSRRIFHSYWQRQHFF